DGLSQKKFSSAGLMWGDLDIEIEVIEMCQLTPMPLCSGGKLTLTEANCGVTAAGRCVGEVAKDEAGDGRPWLTSLLVELFPVLGSLVRGTALRMNNF